MIQGFFDRPEKWTGWFSYLFGWLLFALTCPMFVGVSLFNYFVLLAHQGIVHPIAFRLVIWPTAIVWGPSLLLSIGLAHMQAKGWIKLPVLLCSLAQLQHRGQKPRPGQKLQGWTSFQWGPPQ
jgi:hypothetical protein